MGENFQLYVNIAITIIVSGLLTYFISGFLARLNKWLAFLIPGFMFIVSLILLVFAVTTEQGEGFAALAIVILFLFSLIIFASTFVASIIVFLRLKKGK